MLPLEPVVRRNCFHPVYFLGGSSSRGGLGWSQLSCAGFEWLRSKSFEHAGEISLLPQG